MDLCVTTMATQSDRGSVDTDPGGHPPSMEDPLLTDCDEEDGAGAEEPVSNCDADYCGDSEVNSHVDDLLDVKPTDEEGEHTLSDTPKPPSGKKQSNPTKRDPGTESRSHAGSSKPDDKRVRKFVCRYCHKAFSLMNVLKVHERIHTGEKPYICEICDKAFNQSGSLNRHKNTHLKRSNDNRSYLCHYCPRQFLHSSQLQEHETTEHSSEQNPRKSTVPDLLLRAAPDTGKTPRIGADDRLAGAGTDDLNGPLPQLGSAVNNVSQKSDSAGTVPIRSLAPVSAASAAAAVAGLSMLQRAFACPESMNMANSGGSSNNNNTKIDKLTEAFDVHDTRLNGTARTHHPLGTSNNSATATTTAAMLATTNGIPFDSFTVGSMQCDLCPSKLVNRMEFEHHLGQHFTQSLGFSLPPGFPNLLSMDNNKLSSPIQVRDSMKSNCLNSNGDSISSVQPHCTKPPIQTGVAELHYNDLNHLSECLVDPLNAHSPAPALSTTAAVAAASLFPGCASAAALATLSQLMLNHSSPSSPSVLPQTHPASLLAATAALANPELLLLSEPNLASATGPTSFAQLLIKAMSAIGTGAGQDISNPLLLLHNGVSSASTESTQGLNLAVNKDRIESSTTAAASPVTVTSTMKPASRLSTTAMSPVSGKRSISNGNEQTPTMTPALFPLHFPWFDAMGLDMSPKTVSTSMLDNRVSGFGQSHTEHRKLNPNHSNLTHVSPPGLSETSPQTTKPTNLSVYGFEVDGFSDPDGSSSTGSLPGAGGMMARSAVGAEHSPSSLQSNSRVRQCDFCHKKFNCSSALRIHYRKHSGERPYKCRHCGNAFSQNGTLKRHLQTCKAATPRDSNQDPVSTVNLETRNSANRVNSRMGEEEELDRVTDPDGASDLDSTKPDRTDGRGNNLNESRSPRSTDTSNSTPPERECQSPSGTKLPHTKRSPFTDDETDQNAAKKRTKHTYEWIAQADESKPVDLAFSGAGQETNHTGKMDQNTAQLLLGRLQSAGWLHECSDCQIYFIDRELWSEHRERMHCQTSTGRPFVCAVCAQDLGNRFAFLTHFVHTHGLSASSGGTATNSPSAVCNQSPSRQIVAEVHTSSIGSTETGEFLVDNEKPCGNGETLRRNGCIPIWSDVQASDRTPIIADLSSSTHCTEISPQKRDMCSLTEPSPARNIISTSS